MKACRLTGNTFWLEQAHWDDFTQYEQTVSNVIGRYRMLSICTYSLAKCSAAEIIDVVTNHQFALNESPCSKLQGDSFYLMRDFESRLPGFRFVPVVAAPEQDETWDGETGLVTEAIQRGLKNAIECEAYLCGSPGMIDAAIKVLLELGMNENRIFYDKFE